MSCLEEKTLCSLFLGCCCCGCRSSCSSCCLQTPSSPTSPPQTLILPPCCLSIASSSSKFWVVHCFLLACFHTALASAPLRNPPPIGSHSSHFFCPCYGLFLLVLCLFLCLLPLSRGQTSVPCLLVTVFLVRASPSSNFLAVLGYLFSLRLPSSRLFSASRQPRLCFLVDSSFPITSWFGVIACSFAVAFIFILLCIMWWPLSCDPLKACVWSVVFSA